MTAVSVYELLGGITGDAALHSGAGDDKRTFSSDGRLAKFI